MCMAEPVSVSVMDGETFVLGAVGQWGLGCAPGRGVAVVEVDVGDFQDFGPCCGAQNASKRSAPNQLNLEFSPRP